MLSTPDKRVPDLTGYDWTGRIRLQPTYRITVDKSVPHDFKLDNQLLAKAMRRVAVPESQEILDAIAARLFERLSLLKLSPATILDLGTGDARHLAQLQQLFKGAAVVGADLSLSRLRQASGKRRFWQKKPLLACFDASAPLPIPDNSIDLVVSNMMLPWLDDARPLVAEINRVLVKDGAYFISTAGPDTLIELRRAWAAVDDSEHINLFLDMHDVGDLMVSSGMADPVMDTERITVTYSSVDALLNELAGLGFVNVLHGRRQGLTAASVRRRLAANYPLNEAGGIDATLELVTAHGWSGPLNRKTKNGAAPPGEFYFDVERLRTR